MQSGNIEVLLNKDKLLKIPQGLTNSQFDYLSRVIRAKAAEFGLGDDIVVQGSRAAGTAKPTSDIDIAIRLSSQEFDNFLFHQSKLNRVNPGSAKERTLWRAIETGKIKAGEASLSPVRKQLERYLRMEIDLSVIKSGGVFDNGPQIPLSSID